MRNIGGATKSTILHPPTLLFRKKKYLKCPNITRKADEQHKTITHYKAQET
jgi:hypothetical protein